MHRTVFVMAAIAALSGCAEPAPPVSPITGRLTAADGSPVAGVLVYAMGTTRRYQSFTDAAGA